MGVMRAAPVTRPTGPEPLTGTGLVDVPLGEGSPERYALEVTGSNKPTLSPSGIGTSIVFVDKSAGSTVSVAGGVSLNQAIPTGEATFSISFTYQAPDTYEANVRIPV